MARPTRVLAIMPVLLAIVWMSAYAVDMGAASGTGFDLGRQIDALSAKALQPPQALEDAHAHLLEVRARVPADPTIHELLGVVDSRRGNQPEYLAEAAVHFSNALELRPTSPYSWANLATVKYRMGDTGPQFETAIVRATELGPWEPEVQRAIADFGLAVWDEVSPRTRTAIEGMVAAGMKRKPLELLQIANNRGRLAVACRHLPGSPRLTDPKWSQLCQSMEAT